MSAIEQKTDGRWWSIVYRVLRAVLVAGVVGFLATQVLAVLNEVWYQAGAAASQNPGAFGKVEPPGFVVFALLAPALALVPLPARFPRWLLALRSVLFGALAGYLAVILTGPISWVDNVAVIAGPSLALALFVWGWSTASDIAQGSLPQPSPAQPTDAADV